MEEIKETENTREAVNNEQKTLEILERMEKLSQQQARYGKLQCLFSLVSAVLFAIVLAVVLSLLPKVGGIIDQVDTVLSHAEQVSRQLAEADIEGVMTDLKDVTAQMASTDLGGLAQDVSELVQTTQESVEEAMGKVNSMDLESLNQAIADLASVVKPLAALFGRGK